MRGLEAARPGVPRRRKIGESRIADKTDRGPSVMMPSSQPHCRRFGFARLRSARLASLLASSFFSAHLAQRDNANTDAAFLAAMSDQAAAEALVAVGRSRVSAASSPHPHPHPHPTDDDAEDAPRRKRQRRKAPAASSSAAAAEEEAQRQREREREREDREREREQRERERKRPWFASGAPPHGGPFDLPPLERAFPPFPGSTTPGGYMRSPSAGSGSAPSRGGAGSPAGGVSAAGGYTLPPVRPAPGYYAGHEGSGGANGNGGGGGPLTVDDLERHYVQLHEQRRKTEELLRETERIMLDVKRGLDELRGVMSGEGGGGAGAGAGGSGPEMERGRSREGANVWPVNGEAAVRE